MPGRGSVGDVRVGHRDVDGLADLVANGDVEALADERSGGELAVTVLKFKGLNERAESRAGNALTDMFECVWKLCKCARMVSRNDGQSQEALESEGL